MKKLLYLFLAAGAMFTMPACSEDDYADASTVHVYGENENPPLKGSDGDNGTASVGIQMGDTKVVDIDLNDYADLFLQNMGMSLDEAIAGLGNGSVRFLMINPNRRIWDKTPGNVGDDSWTISSSGVVSDPEKSSVKMVFDKASKKLSFSLLESATAGVVNVMCGFVKTDDSSYPQNVRIKTAVTVADLSIIMVDGIIEGGDYNSYAIEFNEYADNIEYVFGPGSAATFGDDIMNEKYVIYFIKPNGDFVYQGYTAGGVGGYWIDSNQEICNWGVDNMLYYIEAQNVEAGNFVAVGRAPGLASGTEISAQFAIGSPKDKSKVVQFICNFTLE